MDDRGVHNESFHNPCDSGHSQIYHINKSIYKGFFRGITGCRDNRYVFAIQLGFGEMNKMYVGFIYHVLCEVLHIAVPCNICL